MVKARLRNTTIILVQPTKQLPPPSPPNTPRCKTGVRRSKASLRRHQPVELPSKIHNRLCLLADSGPLGPWWIAHDSRNSSEKQSEDLTFPATKSQTMSEVKRVGTRHSCRMTLECGVWGHRGTGNSRGRRQPCRSGANGWYLHSRTLPTTCQPHVVCLFGIGSSQDAGVGQRLSISKCNAVTSLHEKHSF